jgi:ADP-ribosylglycohydrolase
MLGAIVGDIIGAPFELTPVKTKDFELFNRGSCFTDDSVLSIAVAEWLLTQADLVDCLKKWYHLHPHVGYGKIFAKWAAHPNDRDPYNSWGNGAAMRVSPIAWACTTLDDVLAKAKASAAVTHNHPEGLAGAQAVAGSIFLARSGASKNDIKQFAQGFGYNLDRSLHDIRPDYHFNVSCIGSIPEALIAFLESTDFEDAIRNAVSLGGDSDTQGCIAGAIAEAFYGGVPAEIRAQALLRLDGGLIAVLAQASEAWSIPVVK